MEEVDILIPTYRRPAALAVTLTSLCAQRFRSFRVVISDQTEDREACQQFEVLAALRVLGSRGHEIATHRNLPRRGMAEQRQFLLDRARAPYALFLDDDLILEDYVVSALRDTLVTERCGFVGSAVISLSHREDYRPHEQGIEFWNGPVQAESVRPGGEVWMRHHLHNAANIYHVQRRLGLDPVAPKTYRVAWIGGCVMYDVAKLRAVGGFEFWRQLPVSHCGEDVLAQLRVMARFGGCGIIPSGAYHQELPTTVLECTTDAPMVLPHTEATW